MNLLPHTGSWGTPDWGLTELLTGNKTAQGGSDVVPNMGTNLSVVGTYPATSTNSLQVLGANDYNRNVTFTPTTTTGTVLGPQPQYTTTQTTQSDPSKAAFDAFVSSGGYSGWDLGSAWADWQATGGSKAGGTSGGGDPYAGLRNEISSGWDAYLAELDNILNNNLPRQRDAQLNIANSYRTNALSSLDTQKTLGLADLSAEDQAVQTRQARTLRDLTENTRNMFAAGNVMLGSRGAGDSSAANQYSYALTKMANKQRGNVFEQSNQYHNEIANRRFKLQTLYTQGLKDIDTDYYQKVQTVADWFAQQQSNLSLQKAGAMQNKSADLQSLSKQILDNSLAALNDLKYEQAQRRSQLEAWALSNSQNVQQLNANLAGIAKYTAPQQTYSPLNGNISMGGFNYRSPYYGSSYTTEDEDNPFI